MKRQNGAIALSTWRRAALISILLFLSLLWILFDSVLSLTARDEGTVIEIPEFCGMQENEIERDPRVVFRTEYRYDDTVARGVVISQSPRAGTRKKLRDGNATVEVRLCVSLGRERHTLPVLTGTDAREAEATLRTRGMLVEIRHVRNDAHAGEVLFTEPRAGETVEAGERVTLFVGIGVPPRTVEVPDLHGLSRAQALLELAAAGLSLGGIEETYVTEETSGTVVKQSHPRGTVVLAGTKITITVAGEGE